LSTRLIADWHAGRFVDNEPEEFSRWTCTALRDASLQPQDVGPDHDLVEIASQSNKIEEADGSVELLVSCMCRHCRHHFAFRVSSGYCRPDEPEFPMHHYYMNSVASFDDHDYQNFKLNPMMARIEYHCSVCPQRVLVDISLPRLRTQWIQIMKDGDRVREAVRQAKRDEPDRWDAVDPEAMVLNVLWTLNRYLKGIIDDSASPDGQRKRISFRNKTFFSQFGSACDDMFEFLGFEVVQDDEGERYWVPPQLEPAISKTALETERAFYEDVRSEVQSLLDKSPLNQNQTPVKPFPARQSIEKALNCEKSKPKPGTVSPVDDEARDFEILGATSDADDNLLKFAYRRQVARDAQHKEYYLNALSRLANRRDLSLQLFAVSENEAIQREAEAEKAAMMNSSDPVFKAYAHFDLRQESAEMPQYYVNVYRTYRESSPAQKSEHRLALLQIGLHRNSQEIKDEVYKTKMDVGEACSFLSVELEWPMDNIAAAAQSSNLDVDLVILALEAISSIRPADDSSRPAFESILAEIRSQAQPAQTSITVRTGDANEPNGDTVDMDTPVGLANLRNTCYLNSILQYFYSVNAVRELVSASELVPLKATTAHLEASLDGIAHADLAPGRAFVGYECKLPGVWPLCQYYGC
jgi:ubiquitin carboxyl-terminal hydrolase 25